MTAPATDSLSGIVERPTAAELRTMSARLNCYDIRLDIGVRNHPKVCEDAARLLLQVAILLDQAPPTPIRQHMEKES